MARKPEEPRDELEQNDLENWLYYRLPHYLKEYGSYILLGFALLLLGYQLWNWYEGKQRAKVEVAAMSLDEATSPTTKNPVGKLRDLINNPDMPAPMKARAWLALGHFYNNTVLMGNPPEGIQEVKVTRDEALKEAQRAFETVLREHNDQLLAAADAKIGLAVVAENRGEWDVAKKIYEELADPKGRWAGTAVVEEAERKLQRLPQLASPVVFGPRAAPATQSVLDMIGREIGPRTTTSTAPSTRAATTGAATAPATNPGK